MGKTGDKLKDGEESGGATAPADPTSHGYQCGLRGKQGAALTGISAVLRTSTATLPAGSDLESSAALCLTPNDPKTPLVMRFGFGCFRPAGDLDGKPSIFVELRGGNNPARERTLYLLGAPGDGFHSYAAHYEPEQGLWRFLFDGQQVLRLQQTAWEKQTKLLPAFLGRVSVLEATVLGTLGAATSCRFEVCRVRQDGVASAIDTADYEPVADVGKVELDSEAHDAFSIYQPKPEEP